MRRIFERTAITQHILSSIASDATGGGPLDISEAGDQKFETGILRNLLVVCDSTNFDVHFGQKANFIVNEIDDIYASTGNNRRLAANNLYIGWINGNATRDSNLYITIINKDANDPTRTIYIQLVNDVNKRFSSR